MAAAPRYAVWRSRKSRLAPDDRRPAGCDDRGVRELIHGSRLLAVTAAFAVAVLAAGCGTLAVTDPTAQDTTAASAPALSSPPTGDELRAEHAVDALATALSNGDVATLCTPGGIFTSAVVAGMNGGLQSCEAALEVSGALANPPTLAVTGLSATRAALLTAEVRVNGGSTIPLDIVLNGKRWLVSFSGGVDPLTAIEQS
jgi:hypothetical protein